MAISSSIARKKAGGRRASPGSCGARTASNGTSSTPTRFELDGERLRGVRTENGTLALDGAAVTAGIWSKPLAAELGDRLPLESERGYHLMIRDPEITPRIPTADAEGKFVA